MLQAGKTREHGELRDSAHRAQDQPLASIFSHSPKEPSDDSHSFPAARPVHTSSAGLFFLLLFFKNIYRERIWGLPRTKGWEQQSVSRTWLLSLMFPSRGWIHPPLLECLQPKLCFFLTPPPEKLYTMHRDEHKEDAQSWTVQLYSFTCPQLSTNHLLYPNLAGMPQKSDTGRCNLMLYTGGFPFAFLSLAVPSCSLQ